MKPVGLDEFVGEDSEFFLKKPNRTFRLHAWTVADGMWLRSEFGGAFDLGQATVEQLCEVAYHLMSEDSKDAFAPVEVTFRDKKGESIKKKIGGVELLFWNVVGTKEIKAIGEAIGKAIAGGRAPTEPGEKKNQEAKPTGQVSLTPSQVNMDGQPPKSLTLQSEKSITGSEPLTHVGTAS